MPEPASPILRHAQVLQERAETASGVVDPGLIADATAWLHTHGVDTYMRVTNRELLISSIATLLQCISELGAKAGDSKGSTPCR